LYNTHVNPEKTVFTFCTVYVGYNIHILISADDMGLGKTLTMISLVLKTKEESENKDLSEEDTDAEEDEEGESSLFSKNRKCKFHCLIQITKQTCYLNVCTIELLLFSFL
jgi:SNF2 family DNA or RNA helicase